MAVKLHFKEEFRVLARDGCPVLIRSTMMADKEHIQMLTAALGSMRMVRWNQWRLENPSVRPDLSGVELAGVNLSFANMSNADINHADLSRTNLQHANLRHADLCSTNLQGADLSEADLSGAILTGADLNGAILHHTKLLNAVLIGTDLKIAHLNRADLAGALLDPITVEGRKAVVRGEISCIEKIALGLFKRSKRKDPLRAHGGAKPNPPVKNI